MTKRSTTLVASAALLLVLVVVAALLPVPYVALLPGPTTDTLGEAGGKPLIAIGQRRTYGSAGNLNFTTVEVLGTPDRSLGLLTALRGWLDPSIAVVPTEVVYPPGETAAQARARNAEEMKVSQQSATTAALRALGYRVTTRVAVGAVLEGAPALGRLRAADVLLAVDGAPVRRLDDVGAGVRRHRPGEAVRFTVERAGKRQEVEVTTRAAPDGRAFVGITPREVARYPFPVTIQIDDVGGPSAGLMFALGIIDKLTPEDLTGGRFIAGTGTIDDAGRVGPIGGVGQKLIAAREAGATVFLTPAANCPAAAQGTPEGLRLVRVDDLDGALRALRALAAGRTDGPALPTCSA